MDNRKYDVGDKAGGSEVTGVRYEVKNGEKVNFQYLLKNGDIINDQGDKTNDETITITNPVS